MAATVREVTVHRMGSVAEVICSASSSVPGRRPIAIEVTVVSQAAGARSGGRRPRGSPRTARRRGGGRARPRSPGRDRCCRRGARDRPCRTGRRGAAAGPAGRPGRGRRRRPSPSPVPCERRRGPRPARPGACSRALSSRLPTIRSIRRGSESTMTRLAGTDRTASGRRARRSTSRAGRGRRARSRAAPRPRRTARSPSGRRRGPGAGRRPPPAARRPGGCPLAGRRGRRAGSTPRRRARRAASGARGRRRRRTAGCAPAIASSWSIVASSDVAIRLNVSAQSPNSSVEVTGHARRQVAALDPLRGPRRLLDRGEDAPGDSPRCDQRDQDQRRRPDEQPDPERRQRRLDRRRVVDEVEDRVGAGQPAADDEVRLPGDRRPLVADLAAIDGGPELLG